MASGVELATAWVRLVPSVDGINGQVTKALGGVEGEANKAGKKVGKGFSTGFKASMTVVSGLIIKTIGGALLNSIGDASDLEEAGTAVGAIFGNSFKDIDKWAGKANKTLGMTELEALNAAKSYGVFGTAAGLSDEENAKFSTGLTGLAADFASFHNVPMQEAIDAIGSGLRGEAEPLRKFGVLMDDASLKATAMSMGIYDGTGALTQEQKILAANQLITEQAGAAKGDFAKTSEGMANKERILTASLGNLSATIGEALMPVMEGLLDIAQPIVAWMTENPAIVQTLAIALAILTGVVGILTIAMWALSLTPVGLLIGAIVIGVGLLIAAIVFLAMNWDQVIKLISIYWANFTAWLTAGLAAFVGWWVGLWTGIGNFIKNIWNTFTGFIKSIFNGYIAWLRAIVSGLVGWWTGVWTAIGNFIKGVWNGIVSGVRNAWSAVSSWLKSVIGGFVSWWNGVWGKIGKVIKDVFSGIGSFIGGIWGGIVGGIRSAVNSIIGIVNGLIDGINGIVGAAGKALGLNISIPRVPMLANGGVITGSGTVLVGERGPELLNLPKGASVDPDISHLDDRRGDVIFKNYAPIGQSPAQALSQFANRAGGLL